MARAAKPPKDPLEVVLTMDDLKTLNSLLQSCAKTREFLSKCKNCNLDVGGEIKTNEDQEDIAARLKREFFPDER